MKKFISVLLTLCMLVSMSSTAFAADVSDTSSPSTSVSAIDGGHLYVSKRSDSNIAILTNDDAHLIDISISYLSSPNTVYQWTITDYPESIFIISNSFWCY